MSRIIFAGMTVILLGARRPPTALIHREKIRLPPRAAGCVHERPDHRAGSCAQHDLSSGNNWASIFELRPGSRHRRLAGTLDGFAGRPPVKLSRIAGAPV